MEKIQWLREKKEELYNNNKYEEARRFLEAAEKVKEYGVKVLNLENLKKVAIENEDYETAKRIK